LFNAGNYRSFGDSKFIPRLPNDAFERIVYASQSEKALALWEKVKGNIYSIHPEEQLMLGYPADGHVSGYYSDNVSKKDIEFVQAFLDQKNISTLNTRMFKSEKGGKTHFRVVIASSDIKEGELFEHEGHVIRIQYGDFSEAMKKIAENMKKAIPFAANEHQANMLKSYVESFESGSIEAHKESQRHWIRDVGPGTSF
jgi:dipeptidyl-peptidase-3